MPARQVQTPRAAGPKGNTLALGAKSRFGEKIPLSWVIIPIVIVVALGLVAWIAPAFLKGSGGGGKSAGCVSPSVSPSASGAYTCGSSY